jgi:hypothetical protein
MSEDSDVLRNKRLAAAKRMRLWRKRHPEVNKRRLAEWRLKNPDKVKANHKKHDPVRGPMRIVYKDKRIVLGFVPRIGVCNWCRAVVGIDCGQTQMHHEKYDDLHPEKHTIEVCVRCHDKTMNKKRKKTLP